MASEGPDETCLVSNTCLGFRDDALLMVTPFKSLAFECSRHTHGVTNTLSQMFCRRAPVETYT